MGLYTWAVIEQTHPFTRNEGKLVDLRDSIDRATGVAIERAAKLLGSATIYRVGEMRDVDQAEYVALLARPYPREVVVLNMHPITKVRRIVDLTITQFGRNTPVVVAARERCGMDRAMAIAAGR